MSLWWIFGFLIIERLAELALASRNRNRLLARGGREFHAASYRSLVVLHVGFLLALMVESAPWQVPLDLWTLVTLVGFILLQAGRYWCIYSLGEFWNTRIIVLAGADVVCRGPYRLLRHPNYLIVMLEFIIIPLLMRSPITLLIFFPLNLLLLRQRIRLEEQALGDLTDYRRRFRI